MAGFGKQVGKLSIRVLPNAERFKRDIQKLVEECEKKYEVKLNVDADTRKFRESIQKLYQEWDGKEVNLDVALDDAKARAQLSWLARTRNALINVKVNQSPVNKFANSIRDLTKRIAGLNVINQWGTEFRTYLKTMDEKTSTVVKLSLAFGQLASTLTSSLGGLSTMATSLGTVLSLSALAPALFAGAATGIIGLRLALKDASDQLAELKDGFAAIQPIVSENFWAEARQPILDLANNLLPSLTDGFGRVGTALGAQMGTLASSLQSALTPGVMDSFFDTLVETMNIATGAMEPLVNAFVTLGQVGQDYLPRLAQFMTDASNSFNEWVQGAAADGTLVSWIERGITALQQLGSIAASTVGIVTGLSSAASAAGSDGLTTFTNAMATMSAAINNPGVQAALTQFFGGAQAGMEALGASLGRFGDVFVGLMPTLGTIFQLIGNTLGTLLDGVSKGLDDPTFAANLQSMFTGILQGAQGLAPVIPVIVGLVGQLGRVFGTLASQIGPSLAAFKGTVLPVIQAVIDAIEPLIVIFGEALRGALEAVSPAFMALAGFISSNQSAFTTLFGVIAGGVVAFTAIGKAIALVKTAMAVGRAMVIGFQVGMYGLAGATYAVGAAQKIGAAAALVWQGAMKAAAIAQRILNAAMRANPIGIIITAITAIVAALIWFFTQTDTGKAIWAGFMSFLTDAWANISAVATTVFQALGAFFSGLWTGIQTVAMAVWNFIVSAVTAYWQAWVLVATTIFQGLVAFFTALWTGIQTVATTVWNFIVSAVTAYWQAWVTAGTTIFNALKAFFTAVWNGIKTVSTSVWNAIRSAVTAVWNGIKSTATSVFNALSSFFSSVWNGIKSVVSSVWNAIRSAISSAINAVRSVIQSVLSAVQSYWSSSWNTLRAVVSSVWSAIQGAVAGAVSAVQSTIGQIASAISGVRDRVMGAISGAGQWLVSSGRAVIQGFIDGISGMVNAAKNAVSNVVGAVRDFFPFSPAKVGPFSGRGYTTYSGRALVDGFAGGIKGRMSAVRDAAADMMNAASGTAEIGIESTANSLDRAWAQRLQAGVPDYITIEGGVGYDPDSIADKIALKKRQAALAAGMGMVQVR